MLAAGGSKVFQPSLYQLEELFFANSMETDLDLPKASETYI